MKIKSFVTLLLAMMLAACSGHQSSFNNESSNQSDSQTNAVSFYQGYYQDLTDWQNGEELKNKLFSLIRTGYKPLSYVTPNYESNIKADHAYYDYEYLDVVYSHDDVYKSETNKGWQREHAFCASLMCGSLTADAVKMKGRATDFHNLFAAQASANGSRGNKNYGTADKSNANYQNRTVNNGQDGYSFDPKNFEPADKDKGRLARAIFYMATMYKDPEEDTVNNITMKGLRLLEERVEYTAGEDGAFAIGNLSTLLEWNKKYPVDYLEMQHNESVYRDVNSVDGYAQGNRNPYVDFPALADYVYGEKKNAASNLSVLVASETLLGSNQHEHSHYALKEAKRAYAPGDKIANDDYKIVKVYKDYQDEVVTSGYTNSLSEHTFSEQDGEYIDASIAAGSDSFTYRITLNPLGSCNSGEIFINTTGINKGKKAEDQEVTFGGVSFLFNFDSAANISSSNTMTINNINQDGIPVGITIGSNTKPLTKFTLKTKNQYKINAAYIKAFVGNTSSSFLLTIKVGDSVLLNQAVVDNKDVAKVYGTSINTVLEGQLTYIFEGSSSLKINSVAFNAII